MSWFGKLFGGKQAPATPEVLDWRAFTEYYHARVAALDVADSRIDWGETLDDTSIKVSFANGTEARVGLGNYYRQYHAQPDILDDLVEATVAALQQMGRDDNGGLDRERVLPVIKHHDWVANAHAGTQAEDGKPAGPVVTPVVGDLVLAYVEDGDVNMRFLVPSDLERLGVTGMEALHDLALANFGDYARTRTGLESFAPGVFRAQVDGYYDASLFLFADELARGARIAGDVVVAVPARDVMLLCSADDAAAIATLRDTAARVESESPYLVSPRLYVLRAEGWQVLGTH